jgi:hypothetical protein
MLEVAEVRKRLLNRGDGVALVSYVESAGVRGAGLELGLSSEPRRRQGAVANPSLMLNLRRITLSNSVHGSLYGSSFRCLGLFIDV